MKKAHISCGPVILLSGAYLELRHIHIKRGRKSRKMDKSSCRRMDSSQEHHVDEQTMVAEETVQLRPLPGYCPGRSWPAWWPHRPRLRKGPDAAPRPPGQRGPRPMASERPQGSWEGNPRRADLTALAGGGRNCTRGLRLSCRDALWAAKRLTAAVWGGLGVA